MSQAPRGTTGRERSAGPGPPGFGDGLVYRWSTRPRQPPGRGSHVGGGAVHVATCCRHVAKEAAMFESRLQTAQLCLAAAAVFAVTGVLVFTFGPVAVGVFCLLLEHAAAALGCAFYADSKGYSPLIGVPL